MPAVKGKSSLFAKIGDKGKKAIQQTAHEAVSYGRVDLPGGIKSGVALVTKCYFKQYENGDDKGEWYLRAEAVVVEPKEVKTEQGTMKVEGLTTSVMLPLCATGGTKPRDLEENVARVMNELKKLGADPDEIEAVESDEDLFAIAKAIEEAGVYTKFNTSTGKATKDYPNPRTWENWNGVILDYDPASAEEVEDDTEKASDVEEEAPAKPAAGKKPTKPVKEEEPEEEAKEEAAEEYKGPDLDALATSADDSDDEDTKKSQKTLKEIALKAGIKQAKIDDANSWAHVVSMVKKAQGAEEGPAEEEAEAEEEAAEEEAYIPSKDDIVKYKSKKDKKAMEYEVVAVYKKNETADVKSIDDGKTVYKGVKWSELTAS